MLANSINISMGDAAINRGDALVVFRAHGVGSCVSVAFYDRQTGVGGMMHAMLPKSSMAGERKVSPFMFVDEGLRICLKRLMGEFGAKKESLKIVVAGGASMQSMNPEFRLGEQNIHAVRETLQEYGLPLLAEDIGGNHNRTIAFDLNQAKVIVRSPSHTWEISLK